MDYLIDGIIQAIKLIITLNPYVVTVTVVQVLVSTSAVIFASITAIPLAVLLSFKRFPFRDFILTAINTAMGLPPVVVGLFVFVFFMSNGPLGFLDILYTKQIMIFAQYILATPIILGVSIAAINAVPKEIKETAYSLGAGDLQVAVIVLKESTYGILTGVVAGAGRVFAEVGAILTVGGNIEYNILQHGEIITVSKTRTLSTAIPLATSQGDIPSAIAFGLILLLLSLILNIIMYQLQKRSQHE
ncbi:MAG TPA: ABC transporter permease subunit [Euryarchaeota archaeon]|nr:sulfate transport system permease protein CysW [archaeon BMS3Bbin15]HDL15605.1 ABC transporter permease subunit [Euryarchaeota archaeon]